MEGSPVGLPVRAPWLAEEEVSGAASVAEVSDGLVRTSSLAGCHSGSFSEYVSTSSYRGGGLVVLLASTISESGVGGGMRAASSCTGEAIASFLEKLNELDLKPLLNPKRDILFAGSGVSSAFGDDGFFGIKVKEGVGRDGMGTNGADLVDDAVDLLRSKNPFLLAPVEAAAAAGLASFRRRISSFSHLWTFLT